jgi:hypothetical protein
LPNLGVAIGTGIVTTSPLTFLEVGNNKYVYPFLAFKGTRILFSKTVLS